MRIIVLTSFLIFFRVFSFAQSADEQVANCLNTSDFFLLEEIYPKIKNDVETPMLNALTESVLYTAFGPSYQAITAIDSLLYKYHNEIGVGNVKNMLMCQCWLLLRMGEYKSGYDRLKNFIDQFDTHVEEEFLVDAKASLKLYEAFMDEAPPQLIRPNTDCVIPIEIDTLNIKGNENDSLVHSTHIFVPVVIKGKQERFIFDTGCGGGIFLSKEYATRLGARVKMDSLAISGSGGMSYGQFAILDSIQVGNMTFKNVTATVIPPNPEVDSIYKVDAVLGSDIMLYAGEIQIFPHEKKIIFPVDKTPLPATGRNMMRMIGGDAFFLKTYSGDERLVMLFDTGDSYTHLNDKYYNMHKEFVDTNGIKSSKISGGIGGVERISYNRLPSFPFRIGDKHFEIKNISVGDNPKASSQQVGEGALGMAFISTFNKVTISFDNMFVDME